MKYKTNVNAPNWHGLVSIFPYQPNLVLAKLLSWKKPTGKYAACSYPEPDNFTAAAAFKKIPQDLVASNAFIYKDARTGLWVQAVGCKLVPPKLVSAWCQLQLDNGAIAIWVNNKPEPVRLQHTFGEDHDLLARLQEMNKFMLNGQNLMSWFDDTLGFMDMTGGEFVINELFKDRGFKRERKKYPRLEPGQRQRKASKPVKTPLGLFASMGLAAVAHGWNQPKLSNKFKNDKDGSFVYLDPEEYFSKHGYQYR
jgi:hypothetical protein